MVEINDSKTSFRRVSFKSDENVDGTWADLFAAAAEWLRENPLEAYPGDILHSVVARYGDSEAWDDRDELILEIS